LPQDLQLVKLSFGVVGLLFVFIINSSSQPLAFSHVAGYGMYLPFSLSQSSDVLACSILETIVSKSCSSGLIFKKAFSA